MLKRKNWQELLKLLLSLTRQCLPLSSINQFLGLLPWEDVTTKMTICARLLVDRVTQIQLLHNSARSEIKVLLHNCQQFLLCLLRGAIIKQRYREGLCHSNGIRHLHQAASAESCLHQRFCNPPSSIRSRTVHFCEILARKRSSTMCTPAPICINDDLAASQSSITLRSSDNKQPTGVDMKGCFFHPNTSLVSPL